MDVNHKSVVLFLFENFYLQSHEKLKEIFRTHYFLEERPLWQSHNLQCITRECA